MKATKEQMEWLEAALEESERRVEQNPQLMLEVARGLLQIDRRNVAKIERRLANPVYLRGPKKGLPLDDGDAYGLQVWLADPRAAIESNVAGEAWAERQLMPGVQ